MANRAALYERVDNLGERLVLEHMPMVRRVAAHLKARIPPFMETDELVQVGMVGLIEAARGFDAARGIDFEHFAVSRVRGAMLDEVRRLSALSRSAVAFNQSEGSATRELASRLGRAPTVAELAEFMGKDVHQFHRERDSAHRLDTVSMEAFGDEVLNVADARHRQPEAQVEQAQLMQGLADAIERLTEREKTVMQLYYTEELNLKEIGEVLGVTESRVSQILSATVRKLRAQFGPA